MPMIMRWVVIEVLMRSQMTFDFRHMPYMSIMMVFQALLQ